MRVSCSFSPEYLSHSALQSGRTIFGCLQQSFQDSRCCGIALRTQELEGMYAEALLPAICSQAKRLNINLWHSTYTVAASADTVDMHMK